MLTCNFAFSKNIDIAQLVRLAALSGEELHFRTYMKACLNHKGIASIEKKHNKTLVSSTILTLLGPLGILPSYYMQHVIKHMREHETTLLDFLDVFYNTMMQSLCLMLKNSDLNLALTRFHLFEKESLLIKSLSAFAGICHKPLGAMLHCTGVMLTSRPPCSLHRLLSFFLEMPIRIEQFRLLKLPLEASQKTLLARKNSKLSNSFYIGHHAYLYQNMISIKISDLDIKTFRTLMEQKKDKNSPLRTLVKAYLGQTIRHDILLEAKEEAKPTQLSYKKPFALGFDMWCSTRYLKAF
jgi:type VI secretion system ImpH/TssG family protein